MITNILNDITSFETHDAVDSYDTNTLSHRLKLCLNLYKINQSELARKIGVKPQIIQYLCSKNIKSSKFTFELAEALEVNYTWLATGEGTMRESNDSNLDECKIPLIENRELSSTIPDNLINQNHQHFIISSAPTRGRLIATILDDTSMEPRFEKETTMVIDLDIEPKHRDYVLVYVSMSNVWVFREFYLLNNDQVELRPINTGLYKSLNLSINDTILGVVVQTICNFKRPNI